MSDRLSIELGGRKPVYAEGTLIKIDRDEDTITVVFKISKGIAKYRNGVDGKVRKIE